MLLFFALLVISATAHRVWNYEAIFAAFRARLEDIPPISCPACNAFWIPLLVAALASPWAPLELWQALVFPFLAYLPLRLAVWVYAQPWERLFPPATPPGTVLHTFPAALQPDPAPVVPLSTAPAAPALPAPAKGCTSCEQKKNELMAERKRTDAFKQRIVILAPSMFARDAIELGGTLRVAHTDALVQVWLPVSTDEWAPTTKGDVEVRAVLPKEPEQLAKALMNNLIWLGNAKVITYKALDRLQPGLRAVQNLRAFSWVHIVEPGTTTPALPEHHQVVTATVSLGGALAAAQPPPAPAPPATPA